MLSSSNGPSTIPMLMLATILVRLLLLLEGGRVGMLTEGDAGGGEVLLMVELTVLLAVEGDGGAVVLVLTGGEVLPTSQVTYTKASKK